MHEELLSLVRARSGHFIYESGHHGDTWWTLETLCHRPTALLPFVTALAGRVQEYQPEVICGSLVEGAFVALLVAAELQCEFVYAVRFAGETTKQLFPTAYRLPRALHEVVAGKRVVVVNDVISAGSAVRGAMSHVQELGGNLVAVASLAVLGSSFDAFCQTQHVPLVGLVRREHRLWLPETCPLCAAGSTPEYLAHY